MEIPQNHAAHGGESGDGRVGSGQASTAGVLILNADPAVAAEWTRDLGTLGYRVFATADLEEARKCLKSERPSLLLGDISLLSGDGAQLLRAIRDLDPQLALIVLTDVAGIEAAAGALRDDPLFYLVEPSTVNNLKLAIESGLAHRRSVLQVAPLDQRQAQGSAAVIVGSSHALQQALELAGRIARSDANIIIYGESGTGKELFARVMHTCSHRSEGAFIPVDCASLPENLLEAELFGYEKGAFTGAIHTKPGLMELAHRGTLFFDEIAELPMSLQPKLLRALQERSHRRLGGTRIVEFDVRVVSATNRDLRGLVAQRQFREDLFYRLNVVPLHLPPLRKRDKDVALLANHFLKDCGRKSLSAPKRFAAEVLAVLESYPWPGNVRELQNVVEYSCAVARTATITLPDLPEELRMYSPQAIEMSPTSPAPTFKMARACLEAGYLGELLRRYDYNISQAAKAAAIDRKTLYTLLRRHHISPQR